MVHNSGIIQLFIHGSHLNLKKKNICSHGDEKILSSLITIKELRKKLNHDSWEKKLPDHASDQKYRGPSYQFYI